MVSLLFLGTSAGTSSQVEILQVFTKRFLQLSLLIFHFLGLINCHPGAAIKYIAIFVGDFTELELQVLI